MSESTPTLPSNPSSVQNVIDNNANQPASANPTNGTSTTNKTKAKVSKYKDIQPFGLFKNHEQKPIIPLNALPLEQNEFNKDWVIATQYILHAIIGKSYVPYDPFIKTDTDKRIQYGKDVLKELQTIGLKHLNDAISNKFKQKEEEKGIKLQSSEKQSYPIVGFDKIIKNMVEILHS